MNEASFDSAGQCKFVKLMNVHMTKIISVPLMRKLLTLYTIDSEKCHLILPTVGRLVFLKESHIACYRHFFTYTYQAVFAKQTHQASGNIMSCTHHLRSRNTPPRQYFCLSRVALR